MFDDIKKHLLESLQEDKKIPATTTKGRDYPEVLITEMAPSALQAAAGPKRIAYLVETDPLQIQFPNKKGVFEVNASDIVFEASGAYEKAFRAAMKKYGLRSLSDLDTPEEKKGFYNFVDRVWHSKEEKDKGEKKGTHKDEGGWDDPPRLGGEPSVITPVEGEFTDGLRGKHDRMREKMRDEKERARDKDSKAAAQDREQKSRDTNEELPLYSDHQKSHKAEDRVVSKKKKKVKSEDLPLYSDYEKQHREGKKKLESELVEAPRPRPKRTSRGSVRGPVGVNYYGRPFRLLPKKEYTLVALKPKKEGAEPKLGQNNVANMYVLQRIYNLAPSEVATAMKLSAIKWGPDVFLTVDNEDGRRIGIGYSTDDNSTQSLDKRIQQDDLTLHRSIKDKLFKLIFGKELKKKNVDFDVNEVSPPARRHQAKGIKKDIAKGKIPKTYVDKKTGKRKKTNPWAMAWAQYDKYGKPSSGPDKGSKTMKKVPKK